MTTGRCVLISRSWNWLLLCCLLVFGCISIIVLNDKVDISSIKGTNLKKGNFYQQDNDNDVSFLYVVITVSAGSSSSVRIEEFAATLYECAQNPYIKHIILHLIPGNHNYSSWIPRHRKIILHTLNSNFTKKNHFPSYGDEISSIQHSSLIPKGAVVALTNLDVILSGFGWNQLRYGLVPNTVYFLSNQPYRYCKRLTSSGQLLVKRLGNKEAKKLALHPCGKWGPAQNTLVFKNGDLSSKVIAKLIHPRIQSGVEGYTVSIFLRHNVIVRNPCHTLTTYHNHCSEDRKGLRSALGWLRNSQYHLPGSHYINEKRIISYSIHSSLSNDELNYLYQNLQIGRKYFIGWKFRIYHNFTHSHLKQLITSNIDCIPQRVSIIEATDWYIPHTNKSCWVELVSVQHSPYKDLNSSLWNLLVASDPTVHRFLPRIYNKRLTKREAETVMAWISHAKHFVLLRDIYSTNNYTLLEGRWGLSGDYLKDMNILLLQHINVSNSQIFLEKVVLPRLKSQGHDFGVEYRSNDCQKKHLSSPWHVEPFPNPLRQNSLDYIGSNFINQVNEANINETLDCTRINYRKPKLQFFERSKWVENGINNDEIITLLQAEKYRL